MVNLNSEQEQVLAKLTEVGKQRKALKDDIKRYSDMVTAAWEVEFGKYLAQALNLGIPKTRLARAYGTTDPYTVPKLADRVLEEHNGTYSLKHTALDRKSTRLNSSHVAISYAVFCLKKKILKVP